MTLKTKIVVIHSGGNANHIFRDETDKIFKYNNLELSNSFAIWAKSFQNLQNQEENGFPMVQSIIEFISIHPCWSCKFAYVVISLSLFLIIAIVDSFMKVLLSFLIIFKFQFNLLKIEIFLLHLLFCWIIIIFFKNIACLSFYLLVLCDPYL